MVTSRKNATGGKIKRGNQEQKQACPFHWVVKSARVINMQIFYFMQIVNLDIFEANNEL